MTTERTETARRTPDQSRELVLRGLQQALTKHGWGGLTVSRVMDETPLGRSSFYVHFDDLHDAAAALMATLTSLYDRPLRAFMDSDRTPAALLEGIRAAVEEGYAARAWLVPLLRAALADESGLLREHREATFPVAGRLVEAIPPSGARRRLGDAVAAALIADAHDVIMLRLSRGELDIDTATDALGLMLRSLLFDADADG